MVDMPFPRPARWRGGTNSRPVSLAMSATMLVALLLTLLLGSWSAVNADVARNGCDSTLGKLSVYFKGRLVFELPMHEALARL